MEPWRQHAIARDPRYAERWGIAPPAAKQSTCKHLGKDTRALVPCGAKKQCKQKVFLCDVHGLCTIGATESRLASCKSCSDHSPA
jgi:hypothetical protein